MEQDNPVPSKKENDEDASSENAKYTYIKKFGKRVDFENKLSSLVFDTLNSIPDAVPVSQTTCANVSNLSDVPSLLDSVYSTTSYEFPHKFKPIWLTTKDYATSQFNDIPDYVVALPPCKPQDTLFVKYDTRSYIFTQEKEEFRASYSRYFAIAKIASSEKERYKAAKYKDIEELEDYMIVFRYDKEAVFEIKEADHFESNKLIIIGHNNSGKSNLLRMIELVLQSKTDNIVLKDFNAKNLNSNTVPYFHLKFKLNYYFWQRLARTITTQYFQLDKPQLDQVLWYLQKEVIQHVKFMELRYNSNADRTILNCNFYFIKKVKNNNNNNNNLTEETLLEFISGIITHVKDIAAIYFKEINPKLFIKRNFKETDGIAFNNGIFGQIASNITILTQDRGLINNSSLSQVYSYQRALEAILEFFRLAEREHRNSEITKFNVLLNKLTDYTVGMIYGITDFWETLKAIYDNVLYLDALAHAENNFEHDAADILARILDPELFETLTVDEIKQMFKESNATKQELSDTFMSVLDWEVDITNESSKIYLYNRKLEEKIDIKNLSGNVVETLMILASLFTSAGTVMLDEPGLSLHPSKRSILRRAILSECKYRSLVIITHAPELLEEDTYPFTYRCYLRNGSSYATSLAEIETKLMLQTLEPQFKPLLFSDHVLFTEGKTENRFLNIFYRMLDDGYLDAPLREMKLEAESMSKWSVIQLNGALSSLELAKLAELYKIKWKVLLDGDQNVSHSKQTEKDTAYNSIQDLLSSESWDKVFPLMNKLMPPPKANKKEKIPVVQMLTELYCTPGNSFVFSWKLKDIETMVASCSQAMTVMHPSLSEAGMKAQVKKAKSEKVFISANTVTEKYLQRAIFELVEHSEDFRAFCRFLSEDVNLEDDKRNLKHPFHIHILKHPTLNAILQNLAYFDELVTTVEQTNDVANATVKLLKLMRTSTELTLYPGALSEALKELKVDFTNTNELLTTIIHTLSPDLRDLFSYKMCATCAFSTDTISHYKSISDISTPKCDGCKNYDLCWEELPQILVLEPNSQIVDQFNLNKSYYTLCGFIRQKSYPRSVVSVAYVKVKSKENGILWYSFEDDKDPCPVNDIDFNGATLAFYYKGDKPQTWASMSFGNYEDEEELDV